MGRAPGLGGQGDPGVVAAFHTGIDVYRPLAAGYAAVLAWWHRDGLIRPWVAVVVLGVLLAWSLAMPLVRRRTVRMAAVELALAVAAILATRAAFPDDVIRSGQFTLPTVWAAAPVTLAAVLLGVRGGLTGAAVIALADIVENPHPSTNTLHNIVLLVLLGSLIGLAVDLARDAQTRLTALVAERERLKERERLARVVHDGVLQALAYIHRRAPALGPEGVALGDLAGEQERALRRLVLVSPAGNGTHGGLVDLRHVLAGREESGTDVVLPADPVLVPGPVARELDAAVGAALDNVRRHAGPHAHAWVLLDRDGPQVEVTVRDNGAGAAPEVLEAALAGERMGMRTSIRGRLEELGGKATWTTRAGHGTTVRLVLPLTPAEESP